MLRRTPCCKCIALLTHIVSLLWPKLTSLHAVGDTKEHKLEAAYRIASFFWVRPISIL